FYIWKGSVEIQHVYEYGEPLPSEQWGKDLRRQFLHDPSFRDRIIAKPTTWEFSFLSGIPGGRYVQRDAHGHATLVQPCNVWRLRFPFVLLPALLLCGTFLAYCRGRTVSGPAMQSA